MKKFSYLMVGLVTLLFIAGCSNSNSTDSKKDSSTATRSSMNSAKKATSSKSKTTAKESSKTSASSAESISDANLQVVAQVFGEKPVQILMNNPKLYPYNAFDGGTYYEWKQPNSDLLRKDTNESSTTQVFKYDPTTDNHEGKLLYTGRTILYSTNDTNATSKK